MEDFGTVLLLALLPAAGNLAGGMLAELTRVSRASLSRALHAAAGVLLAVVGVELVPRAMQTDPPWIPLLTLVLGGFGYMLLEHLIGWVRARFAGIDGHTRAPAGHDAARRAGPWGIYAGVSIDLFSDGVMIGAGTNVSLALGLLLALGQVPADLPEGFATIATFREKGVARGTRVLAAISFALPILIGATLGYFAVREAPLLVKVSLLTFTAGILLAVAVEELIPEAHEDGEPRFGPLALVAGFALFALVSAYSVR